MDRMYDPDLWWRLGFSHQSESKELLQGHKTVLANCQYICVHSNSVSCWSSYSASFSAPSSMDIPHQLHRYFLHSPIQVPEFSPSPLWPNCLPYNSVQLEEFIVPSKNENMGGFYKRGCQEKTLLPAPGNPPRTHPFSSADPPVRPELFANSTNSQHSALCR